MFEVVFKLTTEEQCAIVAACREIIEKAPLFTKTMPTGAEFRYQCTSAGEYGWVSDNKGFRYVNRHPITDLAFPDMPDIIREIAHNAVAHYGLIIEPESALINWYDRDGRLGLHQDKTEISHAPVVSISLGDDCIFLIGGLKRSDAKKEVVLHSGDVLVMGAEHRLAFHGVKKILSDTGPHELEISGRINVTIRQVYDVK